MSFLLDIIPTDVLILIINIWLDDCVNDICALDAAIVNKELRMRYLLTGCLTIKKEGFMKQIRIGSDETLMAIAKWKEARGLDIKRIYFKQYGLRDYHLRHLGTLFPQLQEIKLCNCFIRLHHILFASLTDLRKLSLNKCGIVISKEIAFTNIEELQIFNMGNMYYIEDGVMIPQNKQGEIYVQIAKSCPKMKVCSISNCSVSYMTIMQMMQEWPLPKEWKFTVSSLDCISWFVSNADLDVLNQQVSTMRKANLESITLNVSDGGCNSYENVKYFLDILLNCCSVTKLRYLELYINECPVEYLQRLLQSIPNMHQMKHLALHLVRRNLTTTSELVDTVLNHFHTLESLELTGPLASVEGLMLFQAITATPNHFHLAHLTSLHWEEMKLTNESINILCNSEYAKQLTSLCLKRLDGVSFETYQQVFTSFSQLQSFELILNRRTPFTNEMLHKEDYKELLSLFDALFDDSCAFANTLQSLTVEAYCYDTSKWEDKQFKEEMLEDHVIPHWNFPFPNLQSCHVDLQIDDFLIAALMTKRLLLNCPALHNTLDWKLMEEKNAVKITQQREKIRRMRVQYM